MAMTLKRSRATDAKRAMTTGKSELRESFERKARERLDMSGEEFIRRLDEGTLPDTPAVDELAILVGEH